MRASHACTLQVLRHFVGMFDGSAEDALEFVGEAGGVPQDVAVLTSLWEDLEGAESREFRRTASTSNPAMMVALGKSENMRALFPVSDSSAPPASSRGLVAGTAAPAWPTSIKRSRRLENNPRAREIAEATLRQKWIGELRDVVVSAG